MMLQEPRVEFVHLRATDAIATSDINITFCEKPSVTNISNDSWCNEIGFPGSATHEQWCSTFYCQPDSSDTSNDVWDI